MLDIDEVLRCRSATHAKDFEVASLAVDEQVRRDKSVASIELFASYSLAVVVSGVVNLFDEQNHSLVIVVAGSFE